MGNEMFIIGVDLSSKERKSIVNVTTRALSPQPTDPFSGQRNRRGLRNTALVYIVYFYFSY